MRIDNKVKTVRGKNIFQDSEGIWHPLSEADMAHKVDAVTWWNEEGRKYGAKSKVVRDFMKNSENYDLEYYRINRSQGAKLGQTYLSPLE